MRLLSPRLSSKSGTTLCEVVVAVLLLAAFFISIFELNATCLRYIDASKESVNVMQAVQDRNEVLRNLAFTDLTTTSYLQNLLASPANNSDQAKRLTETVKLSKYPTPNGYTQLTRRTDGSVSTDSTATDLGTTLVQVDVSATWNMTFGGRSRSAKLSTIISNGTKK